MAICVALCFAMTAGMLRDQHGRWCLVRAEDSIAVVS